MLTTKVRQAIVHSITDIMVAAADVMDMDKEEVFDQSNPSGSPSTVPGQ